MSGVWRYNGERRDCLSLLDGRGVELASMRRWDRHAVLSFFRRLPPGLRALLPDANDDAEVDRWASDLDAGRLAAIIAWADGRVVAYVAVRQRDAPWRAHVGETVLAVANDWATTEMAGHLWRALMSAPLVGEMRKLEASLPHDAMRERALLASIGFRTEGVLTDHVIDAAGNTHDLLLAALPVARSFVLAPTPDAAIADGPSEQGVPEVAIFAQRDPRDAALMPVPVAAPSAARESSDAAPGRARRRVGAVVIAGAALILAATAATTIAIGFAPRSSAGRQSQVLNAAATPPAGGASSATSFTVARSGGGRVVLPLGALSIAVQVVVRQASPDVWFWCVESSFGLPPDAHQCRSLADVRRDASGAWVGDVSLLIAPTWPRDALYFVNMYCAGACQWRLTATRGPVGTIR
jgi:L-amino acid N-acyltransferase YncA